MNATSDHDRFREALAKDWKDHTKQPRVVADRLRTRAQEAETDDQVLETAALSAHVHGEHLGAWEEGLAQLRDLRAGRALPGRASVRFDRQEAILRRASDPCWSLDAFGDADRFYVLTLAVPAITLQRSADEGLVAFAEAQRALRPLVADPAQRRILAVMTANLICDLLDRDEVGSASAQSLLLMLAETSRDLWVRDGSAADVERAAYRLLRCYQACRKPKDYGSGRYARNVWLPA